jgi:hypothetical protein
MAAFSRVALAVLVAVFLTPLVSAGVAQENAEGLRFGGSISPLGAGVTVTAPATVQRGNVAQISASYNPLGVPLNALCILVLPVNSPAYQETLLYNRKYSAVGVSGHSCPLFIPNFIQFEGTAVVIVVVDGAGVGAATFTVTP